MTRESENGRSRKLSIYVDIGPAGARVQLCVVLECCGHDSESARLSLDIRNARFPSS